MNREIKYRAWDKLNENMHEVSRLSFSRDDSERITVDSKIFENDTRFLTSKNSVLMQYTGLKDRNGVEIYEYSELDSAYEVIFKDSKYNLRHIPNNDIIDLHDYWRDKNGEIEVTREYTKV